jgi:hypothetical protein
MFLIRLFVSLSVGLLMSNMNSGRAEESVEASQLRYSIGFHYAKEDGGDEEVLFVEHTIKNIGKSTQVFSAYGFGPYLSNIEPKQLLKSRTGSSVVHRAKRRPPIAEDVIRLQPGAEYKTQSWYWADGTFPFMEDHGSDVTTYEVPNNTEIEVEVYFPLGTADEQLKPFLKPGEHLVQGVLRSQVTRFRFRVLQHKDIENTP